MKFELTHAEMQEAVQHWLNMVRLSSGYPVTVTKVGRSANRSYNETFDVETEPQLKEKVAGCGGAGAGMEVRP